MSDKPQRESEPVWVAWLANPREELRLPPPDSAPFDSPDDKKPDPGFAILVYGCLLPLIGIFAAGRAVYLAALALANGQADLISYLIAAHLPALIGIFLFFATARRERLPAEDRNPKPEELKDSFAFRKARVTEQGVWWLRTELRTWDCFQSFEFMGAEAGDWYRFRLYTTQEFRNRLADRKELMGWRRTAAFVTILLAIYSPVVGSLLTWGIGLAVFGWRYDVAAAFLASIANIVVWAIFMKAAPLLHKKIRSDMERWWKQTDLLFDSRDVSVSEVMCRLERHLPRGTPLE